MGIAYLDPPALSVADTLSLVHIMNLTQPLQQRIRVSEAQGLACGVVAGGSKCANCGSMYENSKSLGSTYRHF